MGRKESDTTEQLHFYFGLLKQWALNFLKAELQSEIQFYYTAVPIPNLFPLKSVSCSSSAVSQGC